MWWLDEKYNRQAFAAILVDLLEKKRQVTWEMHPILSKLIGKWRNIEKISRGD